MISSLIVIALEKLNFSFHLISASEKFNFSKATLHCECDIITQQSAGLVRPFYRGLTQTS